LAPLLCLVVASVGDVKLVVRVGVGVVGAVATGVRNDDFEAGKVLLGVGDLVVGEAASSHGKAEQNAKHKDEAQSADGKMAALNAIAVERAGRSKVRLSFGPSGGFIRGEEPFESLPMLGFELAFGDDLVVKDLLTDMLWLVVKLVASAAFGFVGVAKRPCFVAIIAQGKAWFGRFGWFT